MVNENKQKHKSSRLGVSLIKKVLELHKCKININNLTQPGCWTSVQVELPKAKYV